MKNDIRMTLKQALDNLYSRVMGMVTATDERVETLEEAGYEANTIETISFNGTNVPPDGNRNVALAETDPTVPSWAKANTKPSYTASEVGAIPATDKGSAGGVAELDSGGKVPTSQLPSYVDDVLEYARMSAFPATGETGKIYVAKDTNLTYRWSGSAYVEISPSLALGETSSTAYRGDRGKAAYDHAQARGSAFAAGLYKITTNAEGHVTAASAVVKGDLTDLGLADADDIPTATSDLTNDGDGTSPFATEAYVGTEGGKIDVIQVNGVTQPIVNKTVDLDVVTEIEAITNAEIDAIIDAPDVFTVSLLRLAANAQGQAVQVVEALTSWRTDALAFTASAGIVEGE